MSINNVRGGDNFEKALEDILKRLGHNPLLKVGIFNAETYPDGTPVAQPAADNEFGTQSIPARPFFRNAIAKYKSGWGVLVSETMKRNNMNVSKALGITGITMVANVQQSIIDTNSPPLSPVTIAARYAKYRGDKSKINPVTAAKPLIDTGQLIHSISMQIDE